MAMLTCKDAAAKYPQLSAGQIRRLVASGALWGERYGPVWVVEERSLVQYLASPRRPGPKGGKRRPK